MTNTKMQDELARAVKLSNEAFDAKDWRKARRWGERAEALYAQLQAATREAA